MIRVTSEVGVLRCVLVHRPGPEVDLMVPSMMEDLLFDDILFGDVAREEHDRMRAVFALAGVEVLEAETLLRETLAEAPAATRLKAALGDGLPSGLVARLDAMAGDELAALLVRGLRLDPALTGIEAADLFEVAPLPNWCFQRDPAIVLGDAVVVSSMATAARRREALIASTVFRFHPRFAGTPILADPTRAGAGGSPSLGLGHPRLEGGDVLVLSRDVVAVGLSERTNLAGVRRLARALLRHEDAPRRLVVVTLPRRRAYMHLDTVFTPVDRDAALVHAPLILDRGSEAARVYEIDLTTPEPHPEPRGTLLGTLRRLGIDLEPIPCGGTDPVRQQREQWTDGANAFALAPGTICLYDRNVATADELARRGFEVETADERIARGEPIDLERERRRAILVPSHELSRARGGPHCMTHPLNRAEVE
jgi:arginine deiminase